MHTVEFIGGSLDGSSANVSTLRPLLRMPPRTGARWAEVYERQPDGRYLFLRHGVPPLVARSEAEDAAADAELSVLVASLMPYLYQLDAHFQRRGGYTELTLGPWQLTRRDDPLPDMKP